MTQETVFQFNIDELETLRIFVPENIRIERGNPELCEPMERPADVLMNTNAFCGRLEVDLGGTKQFDGVAAIKQVGVPQTIAALIENIFQHVDTVERCYVISEPSIATRKLERLALALEDPPSTLSGLSRWNLWAASEHFVGTITDRKHIGVNTTTNLAVQPHVDDHWPDENMLTNIRSSGTFPKRRTKSFKITINMYSEE